MATAGVVEGGESRRGLIVDGGRAAFLELVCAKNKARLIWVT